MSLYNKSSKYFFEYSLYLFPLFLLIGPLIAEIFLFFFVINFLYSIIKEKKIDLLLNKFLIYFFIFYISILLSTLISHYNFEYSRSGIFYFRLPLFALAIYMILNSNEFFSKKKVIFFSCFFLIIIFDSLFQYFTGQNLLGYELYKSRISSFFGGELILGGFLMRVLPIFLVFLIMSNIIKEKSNNFLPSVLVSLICSIIYLSGERASFFLLLLLFSTIFFTTKFLRKFILITMVFFVFISFVLTKTSISSQTNPATRMFQKTFKQFTGQGEEQFEQYKSKIFKKFYLFSHDHHGHYTLSIKIFKDHPILGVGPKGFRYLCMNRIYILENDDGCSTHPHNTYIHLLTSNGIIGFSIITFGFFYILKEIFRSRKKLNSERKFDKNLIAENVIISAVFVNLWPFIPNGSFFNNWLSMMYFYPIGFYLYFKIKNEKQIS